VASREPKGEPKGEPNVPQRSALPRATVPNAMPRRYCPNARSFVRSFVRECTHERTCRHRCQPTPAARQRVCTCTYIRVTGDKGVRTRACVRLRATGISVCVRWWRWRGGWLRLWRWCVPGRAGSGTAVGAGPMVQLVEVVPAPAAAHAAGPSLNRSASSASLDSFAHFGNPSLRRSHRRRAPAKDLNGWWRVASNDRRLPCSAPCGRSAGGRVRTAAAGAVRAPRAPPAQTTAAACG
jgi:hypothetical protein